MTSTQVAQANETSLPPALRTAQAAIHFPEVQQMLRRLSQYHLGICMPHSHDQETGQFRAPSKDVTQVESGLQVSFRPAKEIAKQIDRFLPVGWFWQAGAVATVAACEMASDDAPGSTARFEKHKMATGR